MRFDLSLQNFKKSLVDIFSPAVGCRKKALSNFLDSSSSLKTANTGKPALKHKLRLYRGVLARAKRARIGAPWVKKFGKLSTRENLVMT